MFAGVAHDLCRGVEPHRLGIQKRAGKDAGVVALEPAGCIDQKREAGRMAFGKAVAAKTLDLGKAALGEIIIIAIGAHPAQKAGTEFRHAPVFLECGQRPAQPVGLLRRKARTGDGDLHRLFLEQRHAQRLAQDAAQIVGGKADRLLAVPPPDEGVDHVALNGAGADDRDLDHQIVETARAHTRQEIHLRAAFDLKDAQRVGFAQHVIDCRIFGGQRGQRVIDLMMLAQKAEGFSYTRKHPKGEDIDLEDAQAVDIILIPCDDGAILHAGILDRHQLIQPPFGDDETADMLGQVAGKTDDFLDQRHGLFQARAVWVEPDLAQAGQFRAGLGPRPPDLRGQRG